MVVQTLGEGGGPQDGHGGLGQGDDVGGTRPVVNGRQFAEIVPRPKIIKRDFPAR